MAVTIQIRRGTSAQWQAANTVLAEGELGYETDTGFIKVGDGVTAWNSVSSYLIEGSTSDISVSTNPASGAGSLTYDSGSQTFTFTPADISGEETVTSLSLNANVLTYTDEAGNDTELDLALYLDDTNLARLTSGTLDAETGIATFTRDDATTFTVDFSSLLDDTNLARITSASFDTNTGDITFTRDDASTVTASLDGRYILSSETIANITDGTGLLKNDGAGNWSYDNSAYITADSTDTLTNKSGNISQWTNDTGYITDITGEVLDDLSDVNITAPVGTGDLVMFNGVSWRNSTDMQARLDFLEGARYRGETSYYWQEESIVGTPGFVQTFNMANSNTTGWFYITDLEHDMIVNITNHAAIETNRQVFSIVVAVDNNNTNGGRICNGLQIDGSTQTINWELVNPPVGTQGQIDVVEFVVYSTAGVGYNVIGRHWQGGGATLFLVDGGSANSIYTSGDLVLDGGSA
jgi:hypothetical protein